MSQNRRPPAYQEYPAEILAKIPFRTMSLQDRGLFCTMRYECWVNSQLPKKPDVLAKVLGLPVDLVSTSLPAVMPFFEIEGDSIICPELEDYRSHLEERKLKQSQGGKTGSTMTNEKRKANKESSDNTSCNTSSTSSNSSSTLSSNSRVPRRGSDESLVKSSKEKQRPAQFSKEKELRGDPFLNEYEEYEMAEESRVRGDETEYVRF